MQEILRTILTGAGVVILGGIWAEWRSFTKEYRALKAWAHHKGFRLEEWA